MSSKFLSAAVCAGMALLTITAGIGPRQAAAQSFLDGLFGSDAVSPRPAAGYVRRRHSGTSTYAPISPFAPYSAFSAYQTYTPYDRPMYDGGTYRTMCVRMCDGFYFPISYATTSAAFPRDAEACASACGDDARLFYHANPGAGIEDMVDLSGRSYASYPTAFRYRKTLVKGCQCRPSPWSEAERARHRSYALGQAPHDVPPDSVAPPAADSMPRLEAADENATLPQPPQPIDRSMFTSAAPGPAVSPYVAGSPARTGEVGQWGWSSGAPDPASRQRRQPQNSRR
jgi:hypothetical protein